jgi:hypothetical protein
MFIPVPVLPSLPSFPSVFKNRVLVSIIDWCRSSAGVDHRLVSIIDWCRSSTGVDHRLVSIIDRHAGGPCGSHRWFMVAQRKVKLPNEPNLKTAPPAIPASREGRSDEIYKHIKRNGLRAN